MSVFKTVPSFEIQLTAIREHSETYSFVNIVLNENLAMKSSGVWQLPCSLALSLTTHIDLEDMPAQIFAS